MASLLGGNDNSRANINWATLAAWSSHSVGGYLTACSAVSKQSALDDTPLGRCAADVLRGLGLANRIVFEEIATTFEAFIAAFEGRQGADAHRFDRFAEGFRKGATQPDKLFRDPSGRLAHRPQGGQTRLAMGMRRYFEAMCAADPHRRAELMMLANAEVAVHEQTRLQSYLARVQRAPLDFFGLDRHGQWVLALSEAVGRFTQPGALTQLGRLDRRPARQARSVADVEAILYALMSRWLFLLRVPGAILRLGEDIPLGRSADGWMGVREGVRLPSLRRLLARYDALALHAVSPEASPLQKAVRAVSRGRQMPHALRLFYTPLRPAPRLQGTGANDWASLPQRLRFIFALFRSRAHDARLWEQPWSA